MHEIAFRKLDMSPSACARDFFTSDLVSIYTEQSAADVYSILN